jgi:hypothetical protein
VAQAAGGQITFQMSAGLEPTYIRLLELQMRVPETDRER